LAKGGRSVEAVVEELARPLADQLNLELVDVEYVMEAGRRYLRLYIDKPGGVTLDDCEALSRLMSDRLDEVDPIPDQYYLEVSSPGVERPLKRDTDFARFAGQKVEVSTFAPVNGQKVFVGELVGLVDGQVCLRLTEGKQKGQEACLDRKQVARARLRVF
jgi:ribosome maturation factor RimP